MPFGLGLGMGLGSARGAKGLKGLYITGNEIYETAAIGAVVGYVVPIGGSGPYIYELNNSYFQMNGNAIEVKSSLTGLSSVSVTVKVTADIGGSAQSTFSIFIYEFVDNSTGGGIDDGVGYDNAQFEITPQLTAQSNGVKLAGRSGGTALLIRDIGQPAPNHKLTTQVLLDSVALKNGGKEAFIGFGLLDDATNDFWFGGIAGDGNGGLQVRQIYGAGKFNGQSGWTTVNAGAPSYGAFGEANWIRAIVDENGTNIKIQTSPDGQIGTWVDEIDVTPSPFANAVDAPRFGLALFLPASDNGSFQISTPKWREMLWQGAIYELVENTLPYSGGDALFEYDTIVFDNINALQIPASPLGRSGLVDLSAFAGRYARSHAVFYRPINLTSGNNWMLTFQYYNTDTQSYSDLPGTGKANLANNQYSGGKTVTSTSHPQKIEGPYLTYPVCNQYKFQNTSDSVGDSLHRVYATFEIMPKHYRGMLRYRTGSNQSVTGIGVWNEFRAQTVVYDNSGTIDQYDTDPDWPILIGQDFYDSGDYLQVSTGQVAAPDTNYINVRVEVEATVGDPEPTKSRRHIGQGGSTMQTDVNISKPWRPLLGSKIGAQHLHQSSTPANIQPLNACWIGAHRHEKEEFMGVQINRLGRSTLFCQEDVWKTIDYGQVNFEIGADWVDLDADNTKIIIPAGVTKVAILATYYFANGTTGAEFRTLLNGAHHVGGLWRDEATLDTSGSWFCTAFTPMCPVAENDYITSHALCTSILSNRQMPASYHNSITVWAVEHKW